MCSSQPEALRPVSQSEEHAIHVPPGDKEYFRFVLSDVKIWTPALTSRSMYGKLVYVRATVAERDGSYVLGLLSAGWVLRGIERPWLSGQPTARTQV